MRKLWVFALLLLWAVPLAAQETKLVMGEPATAEMTAEVYEFAFTFDGKGGDVVMVQFFTEILGDFDRNRLILLSANGRPLAQNDSVLNDSRLFAQLSSDGVYTVIVTRPDGATGRDVGEFSVTVQLVPEIELNTQISDTVSSADSERFYVYRGAENFFLSYTRTEGAMIQEITVNTINRFGEDGQLKPIGTLSGEEMNFGIIGTFFGDRTYIIRASEQGFTSSFNPTNAVFDLELVDAAKLQ